MSAIEDRISILYLSFRSANHPPRRDLAALNQPVYKGIPYEAPTKIDLRTSKFWKWYAYRHLRSVFIVEHINEN